MFSFDEYHIDVTVSEEKNVILSIDKEGYPIKRVFSGKRIESRRRRSLFERYGGIIVSILAMFIVVW